MSHEDLALEHHARFWSKVSKTQDCWEWTAGLDLWGYGRISVPNGKHNAMAHRVSWVMENGPIPDGMFVLHRCDNCKCVRPAHLYLGTLKDNSRDAVARLRREGRAGAAAKLTIEQVRVIKRRLHQGDTLQAIAVDFGVVNSTISHIRRGRFWAWLLPELNGKMEGRDRIKVTEAVAAQIRARLDSGETQQRIADDLGISQNSVSDVKLGKRWG